MSAVVWCDPPTRYEHWQRRLPRILAELKSKPGEWGQLVIYPRPSTAYKRVGYLRQTCGESGFEFRAAKKPGEGYGVWGRWMGDS